ncbi:cyclic lactone autoinducer peptide [Halothermothrix orenii]|nr:cyclic lactone autoinducer peptide [Halothermothrix orenii]
MLKILVNIVADLVSAVSRKSVSTSCIGCFYQPDLPEK